MYLLWVEYNYVNYGFVTDACRARKEAFYLKVFLVTSNFYFAEAVSYSLVPFVRRVSEVICLQVCLRPTEAQIVSTGATMHAG